MAGDIDIAQRTPTMGGADTPTGAHARRMPGLTGCHPSAPEGQMSSDRRGVPSITPTSGGRGWGPLPGGRAPCPTCFSYAGACLRGMAWRVSPPFRSSGRREDTKLTPPER